MLMNLEKVWISAVRLLSTSDRFEVRAGTLQSSWPSKREPERSKKKLDRVKCLERLLMLEVLLEKEEDTELSRCGVEQDGAVLDYETEAPLGWVAMELDIGVLHDSMLHEPAVFLLIEK